MKNLPLLLSLIVFSSQVSAQSTAMKELAAAAGTAAESLPAVAAVEGAEAPVGGATDLHLTFDARALAREFSTPADPAALAKSAGRWVLRGEEINRPWSVDPTPVRAPSLSARGSVLEFDVFNDQAVNYARVSDAAQGPRAQKSVQLGIDADKNLIFEDGEIDADGRRDWSENYRCRVIGTRGIVMLCQYSYGRYQGWSYGENGYDDLRWEWQTWQYIRVYGRAR